MKEGFFYFEWIIKPSLNEKIDLVRDQIVSSPPFTTPCFDKNVKWCLQLQTHYKRANDNRVEFVFLKNLSACIVETVCRICLKIDDVKVERDRFVRKTFAEGDFLKWKFEDNNPLTKFCLKNNNVIECRIEISNVVNQDIEFFEKTSILNDFENLFSNKKFSDLTVISADKKELYVYKGILASRSPVFAGMFEHDMMENSKNKLFIVEKFME